MTPSQSAICPTRPIASSTADFAESALALVTASMVPVSAAVQTPPTTISRKIQFSIRSAFYRALGQAADEMTLEQEKQRHHRDAHQNRSGCERTPIGGLRADVAAQHHRERIAGILRHESGREDELVPCGHEREERGHGDRGARQR